MRNMAPKTAECRERGKAGSGIRDWLSGEVVSGFGILGGRGGERGGVGIKRRGIKKRGEKKKRRKTKKEIRK